LQAIWFKLKKQGHGKRLCQDDPEKRGIYLKIIGVCGKIGSGKDTFADYLVRKHGFVKITMGNMILNEMQTQGIKDIDRFKMQQFSDESKKKLGKDVWARACVDYARKNQFRRVVISGIRDSSELNYFRLTLAKDFVLVCINSEQEIRFKRAKARKSLKDMETFADFIRQEVDEAKLFDLYNNCQADYRFDNSNLVIELYSFAEDVLTKLKW
jgi:dephospho-CoA kinase